MPLPSEQKRQQLQQQLYLSDCELTSIALRPSGSGRDRLRRPRSALHLATTKKPRASGSASERAARVPTINNGSSNASASSNSASGSDVGSDDDAVSIASRLSQIVVEQECKLTGGGTRRSLAAAASRRAAVMSRSQAILHSACSDPAAIKSLGVKCPSVSSSSATRPRLVESCSVERLPEIQVTKPCRLATHKQDIISGSGSNGNSNSSSGDDLASNASLPNQQDSQQEDWPQIQSKHLPERGDLRRINTSGQARSTPNSPRLISKPSLEKDQPPLVLECDDMMLNIRRSTWTLAEFDQTFSNRSPATPFKGSSDPELGTENAPLGAASLLMRATKNSADESGRYLQTASNFSGDINHHQQQQQASESERRGSYTHSIVSIASSLDNFSANLGRNLRQFANKSSTNKLEPRKQKPLQDDNNNSKSGRAAGGRGPSDPRDPRDLLGLKSSCFNMNLVRQYLPIVEWLPRYSTSLLYGDLMAGIAVAVLNISTSLSAAVVAETDLSPAFKTSIVNTFVYAILCSSRYTSFGSYSIMSQMLLVSVQRALSDELILDRLNLGPTATWEAHEFERWHLNIIIMYTFLIGLIQLICGLLNLGNILASFIPEALSSSMIAATAFTMAIGQLANMCGTSNKILWSIDKNTTELWADLKDSPADITDLFANLFRWIQQLALLIRYHEQINPICVLISAGTVLALTLNQYIVQRRLKQLFKRDIFIPIELIVLIVMIIVSYALNLGEQYQVPTCGPISMDFGIPNLPNLRLIRELWFQSTAAALISFTTVHIMSKTYSNRCNYEVDSNQELIACGAGNLIGGLFDALPAAASFSRTAGQVEAGGNTQMASIINCILLTVVSHFLGHHVALLPVCVMAATLFFGFARMMTRIVDVLKYWRVCKVDFAIWIVTFVAILASDLVNGFVYGFIFSILTMLYRAQNRRCYLLGAVPGSTDVYVPLAKYKIATEIEALKIFQFCGPIHYVSADLFERLLRHKTRVNVNQVVKLSQDLAAFNPRDLNLPTHIILDFSMISFIDSAGVHVLKKIIQDYQRINITIFIASLASHVAATVRREPSLWIQYQSRFYVTLADAVHQARQLNRRQLESKACDATAAAM